MSYGEPDAEFNPASGSNVRWALLESENRTPVKQRWLDASAACPVWPPVAHLPWGIATLPGHAQPGMSVPSGEGR
jgi:hypothetical protein